MGSVCSINTEADADQDEKSINGSSHKPSMMHQIRQMIDKMTTRPYSESIKSPLKQARGAQVRLGFQHAMMKHASAEEQAANEMILGKRRDDEGLYRRSPSLTGLDGKPRQPVAHDHFSRNVEIIEKTQLLKAARQMPKGSHLHLHFNSTLLPGFLLDIAKEMDNMYISSPTHKLRSKHDFDNCEIVFQLQKIDWSPQDDLSSRDARGPNIFRNDYELRQTMRYQYFRKMWNQERSARLGSSDLWNMDMECDDWLISKLIFSREDIDLIFDPANNSPNRPPKHETKEEEQTRQKQAEDMRWPKNIELDFQASPHKHVRERATRAWEKFNGRTRMMKGLFNYEKAFRAYTRKCLEEFVKDNVQYAEIRPNFMKSNQVIRDDGSEGPNNFGLMEIIIEEYENFMKDIGDMDENGRIVENRKLDAQGKPIYTGDGDIPRGNGHTPSLGGMKVIYCTPRSFPKPMVKEALDECIRMKKMWPQYIAGFDLVGEESYDKRYPLRYFEEEFRQFQEDCRREQLDIPFLFHCGETPDDIEGNLECAVDLDAKRVGHGYALPEKPKIMEQMKIKNICVEACPISNMVLGLVEHMDEHRIYELLAHEVHCTLNSDNGTLFRSTLSHDFYEVMVGNQNMNLYGWRQLARWSIDHSCMSQVERERVLVEWERRWKEEFIPYLNGQPVSTPTRLKRLEKIGERQQQREAARLSR
ncbi:Metallo-dependent hydrolase [Hypomontagnella monticulosa]|nr:Metallo-dependent hydrolase [Hypomontagnella monticulosa]